MIAKWQVDLHKDYHESLACKQPIQYLPTTVVFTMSYINVLNLTRQRNSFSDLLYIKGLLTDRKTMLFILVHSGLRFLNQIRVYRNKIRPLFRKIQHAKHGLLITVKSWLTCSNA